MPGRRSGPADAIRGILGLAARAGALIPGTERVRAEARRDGVRFVIVAGDASRNARAKLVPLLEAREVPYAIGPGRAELGAAVGRAPLSAVGLTDASLADRARAALGAD